MAVSIGANQGVFETVIRVSDEASDKIKQFADGAGKSIGEANEKAKDIGKSLSEVPSPLEEIKGKALAAAVATCEAIDHLQEVEVNRLQDLHNEVRV